ncbi:MAG: hypothetical protein M3P24_01150 [Gemmatimonadota bacterium]|nr:hypothetical protein [Gemmatimonadota bacterium]
MLLVGTLFLFSPAVSGARAGSSAPGDRESPGLAEACATAPGAADADGDELRDACEHALAAAFAPLLVFDAAECGWDTSVTPARVGGGYLYAAQPVGEHVRVAYLPAYYRDCGWRQPVCQVTRWLCDGHPGDSEAVVVELSRDPSPVGWRLERVFLSAHCHGRSAGRCRWYPAEKLESVRGAPVVWVASGKHGGYPSRAACDGGHWGYDSCDRNSARVRFPVLTPRQNIGSRARPFPYAGGRDCVGPEVAGWGSALADPAARECFWEEGAAFRGWQRKGGATGYARYLREVAGF